MPVQQGQTSTIPMMCQYVTDVRKVPKHEKEEHLNQVESCTLCRSWKGPTLIDCVAHLTQGSGNNTEDGAVVAPIAHLVSKKPMLVRRPLHHHSLPLDTHCLSSESGQTSQPMSPLVYSFLASIAVDDDFAANKALPVGCPRPAPRGRRHCSGRFMICVYRLASERQVLECSLCCGRCTMSMQFQVVLPFQGHHDTSKVCHYWQLLLRILLGWFHQCT